MARPKKEKKEFQVPSDPRELQDIRDTIFVIEGHLSLLEDRKAQMKASYDLLKEKYAMPASLVKDWVKAHRDDKFDEMVDENDKFETGFHKVMNIEVSEGVRELYEEIGEL